QGSGEPGALNAVERDQAGLPVLARPVDGEVGNRLAFPVELGPDARVVGMQALGLQTRIVAADEIEELRELLRLEAIIDIGDPGDVWTELAAPGNIDGGVETEPSAVGHRVDVAPKRRATGERIVLPLGVVCLRGKVARWIADMPRKRGGIEARAVDE